MKELVLEYLKVKFESSVGSQGCYITSILIHFDIDFRELNLILIDLWNEKKIIIKLGVNGKLIYYKK